MSNTRHRGAALLALTLGLLAAPRGFGAADNGLGQRPYLGWSSWSLEATKYPGYGGMAWLTAEHVKQQSDALHRTLQTHGYVYVNMDSGWADGFDGNGRPKPDAKKFPLGVADVANYVHRNGQKLGIYWIPGVLEGVYQANPPILGTAQHVQDIVVKPLQPATGWGFGYKIDYTKPGAQAYVNSVADQFAAWGVDFLKLDGVTPGSDHTDLKIDARSDVAAWAAALAQTKRPIWLELSWKLDRTYAPVWRQYADGRRVTDDVETYGPTLTGWGSMPRAFEAARDWAGEAGAGKGWNDLDSLDIGSGAMDGLTLDERQTVMTLWAISGSPLYTGDDLTKLDPEGVALLTNDEVIAVDQAGHPAAPVVGNPDVWVSTGADGSKTVALFNLGDKARAVTVRPADLGLTGEARARDLWAHTDLGVFTGSVSLTLSPHGSRLFTLVADAPPAATTAAIVDPSIQYQTWEGWGTSLAWWAKVVGGYPEPIRSEYIDKAFDPVKGLGLNIVRYNIGGGENPAHLAPNPQMLGFRNAVPGFEPSPDVWDWTADANQRWVLQAAIKRGVNQLEAFSNSPPWWMTVSGSVTGGQGGADNLRPDQDAAFADYLTEVTKHFRDAWGITFRDLEPLNEPSGGWHFGGSGNAQEGCHVDRPHQNLIIQATIAALERKGLSAGGKTTATASDEPSIGDGDKTFPFYDTDSLRFLSKINVHSYGGGDRTQLSNFAVSHGKDLWLSEDGDGDPSGLSMARNITDDLNGLHPSAWVTWQVVDSSVGWGFFRNPQDAETDPAYTVNKKYYVMAQYSRFLRPGYKIIAITDPNSVAAWDAKTGTVVFITRNGRDTDLHIGCDLSRFTKLGASATVWRTSPTEDLVKLPPIALAGKRFTATVPARSVTTFVIKGAAYTGKPGFDYRDYYVLVNRGSGSALSVAGASPASAAASPPARADGASRQWSLRGMGGGDYKIINFNSGLALDVSQSSTVAGAAVLQYSDNGGDNQLWRLVRVSDGVYKLVNRHSGLVLGVSGAAGASPTQQADDGSAGQQWRFVKAAESR